LQRRGFRRRPDEASRERWGGLVGHAAEVLIQRKQRIRFEFGENPPEPVFNPVNRVEKGSAVHPQLPGTEPPIRAQQEVKPENLILKIVEHTTANQTKVGYIVFSLARVGPPPFFAATEFKGNTAGVGCVGNTIPKTVVAGPKNGPEYALARYFSPFMDETKAITVANAARFFSQTNCVRSIPLHFENVLPAAGFEVRKRPSPNNCFQL
jgi:hypothetical protein